MNKLRVTIKSAKKGESLCFESKKGTGEGLYVFEVGGLLNVVDELG